ncbi:conserved uncharacterized protein, related to heparinase II/III [Desulfobacula toluolica Tol2]|uniref:Conserved uncharacterized protein, related to heparinase II/III n=2 Tax=Desulfobacula toluolica TaxID=28223 RepID=K0NBR2_DESTT|nr:conserved uncharacterized protein, related to heparinase II/III [Desulfobacula toluolica Tol2]
MTLPEIPWRIREKSKKNFDKTRNFKSPEICLMPEYSIFSLYRDSKPQNINGFFPKTLQKHLSIANLALKNHFSAFGINVFFNSHIDWHRDPVTERSWPKSFWGDIDYRDKRFGGIKFVWEINRLYYLFPLAISYRITNDQKYADKILFLIKSWIKENPYPVGVNWSSGIEVGIRLANLVWALSFLENYDFATDDLKNINTFVWFHANHLKRYPSKFSSSNNHLLAEGFGLFVAGLYFPHLKGSETWFNQGKKILETEISRQILPDGGSFEYSTTYLSFVIDFFLLFKIICDINGIEYTKNIDKRLETSCEFIKSIMDKNGNMPNIGDQDSAVLVNFGISSLDNFSSILNTASLLFDRKDFVTAKPDLKTWILTGFPCELSKKQNYMGPKKSISLCLNKLNGGKQIKNATDCSFQMHSHSGLAVIKDYIEEKEVLFIGNAMPLGMAPLYAHGHLDALSFTLSVNGLEMFIDPGTYRYHNAEKWRTYFRSTAAHNTLRINKTDMSDQQGDFMFGKPYRIIENCLIKKGNKVIWKAGHDAYLKKKTFAGVTREVVWNPDIKEFMITDSIKQNKKIFIEQFFHCHPECRIKALDKGFIIKRRDEEVILAFSEHLNSQILCGDHEPVSGWYSQNFNEITETFTIRFYGDAINDSDIITRIILNS